MFHCDMILFLDAAQVGKLRMAPLQNWSDMKYRPLLFAAHKQIKKCFCTFLTPSCSHIHSQKTHQVSIGQYLEHVMFWTNI